MPGNSRVHGSTSRPREINSSSTKPRQSTSLVISSMSPSTTHVSNANDPPSDIKKLVCMRCWESIFSRKSFETIWEGSPEGVRRSNEYKLRRELYESPLTYRTPPWDKILESADAHCGYCVLLRNAIRDSRGALGLPHEPAAGDISVVTVLFNIESANKRIMITLWTEKGSLVTRTSIYAEPNDPASRYITARNVAWNVNDIETYKLAQKCIDDCSRHENCPKPAPSPLPTRVLDCSDPLRLRLVTTTPSMKDYFAALSYVWGGPQLHSTTLGNLAAYNKCIDPAKIPKTISDAVTVARRLNLRYLWVDSFCIIQDSDDDKAHELARMRLIFRDAFITILAARANAVSEGFLKNTPPSKHFEPIRLPFWCPDGSLGTIMAIRRAAELSEPVDSRAWCLAERVLSPRMLVFSTLGLQYECQMGHVNVNGSPLGLPSAIPRLPDHAFTSEPGKDEEWQRDMCWDTILQRYTERHLTVPTDKLAALVGVAEQVHRLWPQSQYVAGLWTHKFPSGLLWRQRYLKARPNVYRSPSWSWAAVDGQLVSGGMTDDSDGWRSSSKLPKDSVDICEVKDVAVGLKHPNNIYGEVISAHLVLSADVMPATWDMRNMREYNDSYAIMPSGKSKNKLLIAGPSGRDGNVGSVQMDALEPPKLSAIEVLLAGVTKNGVPLPFIIRMGQHDICGLMLIPIHDKRGSGVVEYRRVGKFLLHAENWSPICRQDVRII